MCIVILIPSDVTMCVSVILIPSDVYRNTHTIRCVSVILIQSDVRIRSALPIPSDLCISNIHPIQSVPFATSPSLVNIHSC